MKIKIFLIAILFSLCSSVFAQEMPPSAPDSNRLAKFILADAQIAFENNDYPTAFLLAQDAVDTRKAESEWSVYTLETQLRKPNAQKVGKDIEQLLYFFKSRQDTTVVQIIERVIADYSYEYFDFSIDNLLEYVRSSENFPEADYLLGRLYFIEGEVDIAESYFIRAYENRFLLDIPDVQFDILYSMAELFAVQKNWNNFEEVLLVIASEDDSYYVDGKPSPFLNSVTAALKNGMDADRFFLLFRTNYSTSLLAWHYLTYYYDEQGFPEKALETAILLATSTLQRVDEVLEDRDIHYTYTTLEKLFQDTKLFTDVMEWAESFYFWEGFYVLAQLTEDLGYEDFSRQIFISLAMECPVYEWRVLSERALEG